MNDTTNCPYCQAEEKGFSDNWGMSDEGWEELKRIHDEEHLIGDYDANSTRV